MSIQASSSSDSIFKSVFGDSTGVSLLIGFKDAVASFSSVSCDQVIEVAPTQHVDDRDEAHQADPVHQLAHKDEHTLSCTPAL